MATDTLSTLSTVDTAPLSAPRATTSVHPGRAHRPLLDMSYRGTTAEEDARSATILLLVMILFLAVGIWALG